jgi:hypothetical protein
MSQKTVGSAGPVRIEVFSQVAVSRKGAMGCLRTVCSERRPYRFFPPNVTLLQNTELFFLSQQPLNL